MRTILTVLWLCLVSTPAFAAGVDTLKSYLRDTTSGTASFTQVVFDRSMRKLQETSGTMQFQRPGRIRWSYLKPYEQTIVGDGEKLWIYDKDLNQVTVKPMGQALGGSPAALLAGSDDIEKDFRLSATGVQEGLEWVEATPRSADATFQKVRLGFGKGGLEAMELTDSFGQTTIVRFGDIVRNPSLAPGLFKFAPPKGADVISG
jgi:outer membrane lipoprotein carrier protein